MTPEQMRGLLPTAEILSLWGVVEDAREWVGLDLDLMSDFLEILGARMLTSLPLLAGLDPVVVRRAIGDVRRPFAEVAEGLCINELNQCIWMRSQTFLAEGIKLSHRRIICQLEATDERLERLTRSD